MSAMRWSPMESDGALPCVYLGVILSLNYPHAATQHLDLPHRPLAAVAYRRLNHPSKAHLFHAHCILTDAGAYPRTHNY